MVTLISQTGYILIAVAIIGVLLVIFFASFIAYRRCPEPKGSIRNKNMCASCNSESCIYKEKEDKSDE